MQNTDEEIGPKIEVQGLEEPLLPTVVEAAGSCNSKETTDTCIN